MRMSKRKMSPEVQLDPNGYNGNLTSRQAGQIGGLMVKKLIAMAQTQLDK